MQHHHQHHHQPQHSRKHHHRHHYPNYPNYTIFPYRQYTIVGTPVVYQLNWKTSLIIFGVLTVIIGIIYLILYLTKSGPFNKHKHDEPIEPTRRPRIVSFNT
jgi:hypothetical protein